MRGRLIAVVSGDARERAAIMDGARQHLSQRHIKTVVYSNPQLFTDWLCGNLPDSPRLSARDYHLLATVEHARHAVHRLLPLLYSNDIVLVGGYTWDILAGAVRAGVPPADLELLARIVATFRRPDHTFILNGRSTIVIPTRDSLGTLLPPAIMAMAGLRFEPHGESSDTSIAVDKGTGVERLCAVVIELLEVTTGHRQTISRSSGVGRPTP